MKFHYSDDRPIPSTAAELVRFDADSIRQIASGLHRSCPDVWIVDPDGYEKKGHILRDTESARLLAYSSTENVLYASDGCNACAKALPADLPSLLPEQLSAIATQNSLPADLLTRLAQLVRDSGR